MKLTEAVSKNNIDMVKELLLIEKNAENIRSKGVASGNLISLAKTYEMVELLLINGADPFFVSHLGKRPAFFGCAGDIKAIKLFVEKGIDIKKTNMYGESILFEENCSDEVADFALSQGLDPTIISNNSNESVLFHTSSTLLANEAIRKGISVNLLNSWSQNALFTNMCPDIIEILLKNKCSLTQKDEDLLPLMLRPECIATSDCKKIELLIQYGIDINVKDKYGRNGLNLLWSDSKMESIAEILLKNNIEICLDKDFDAEKVYEMAVQHIALNEKQNLHSDLAVSPIFKNHHRI